MTRAEPAPGSSRARGFPWACLLLLVLAAAGLLPATARSADGTRTIALVDFAVRAPERLAGQTAWLGPALTELLQAKMQLFGGTLVLERTRVRVLLRDAKADAKAATDDPGVLAAVLPAQVLIAGSVSVDPQDPRRIRVQARAFEVETSKIVSETTFTGTDDLVGLLKIAEDLARTLASGLKLSYTPEQLAYAEPAKIDTLRLFVAGEEHLAAGRHREAIAALQQALEGNEGRYYAAAHRLQGEAYQALANSSTGRQDRAVREEYLKKFKEDARAAAGAIYDLGLAYETNRMWAEAASAYADYVAAASEREDAVIWRRPIVYNPTIDSDSGALVTLELWPKKRWTVIDAGTGATLSETVLPPPAETGYRYDGIIGYTADRVYLTTRKYTTYFEPMIKRMNESGYSDSDQYVVAMDRDANILWRRSIASGFAERHLEKLHDGKIFLIVAEPANLEELKQTPEEKRRVVRPKTAQMLTLDAASGEILSRVVVPNLPDTARGLDVHGATLVVPEGVYDLRTGTLDRSAPADRLPTGRARVFFRKEAGGTRLFRDGKELIFVPEGRMELGKDYANPAAFSAPESHAGQILMRGRKGYLLVDPDLARVTPLYADYTPPAQYPQELPLLVGRSPDLLLFLVGTSADSDVDAKYGIATSAGETVVNLIDPADGRLIGKGTFGDRQPIALLGGDLLMISGWRVKELARVRRAARLRIDVVSPAEAQLRIAACALELGDLPRTRESLARFDEEARGDARADLLRLRLETLSGNRTRAAKLALRVMLSGWLTPEDLPATLEALPAVMPGVRTAYRLPAKGRFQFNALIPPGLVVMTPEDRNAHPILVVLDTVSGRSRALPVPEFTANPSFAFSGQYLYLAVLDPKSDPKLNHGYGPGDPNSFRIRRIDVLSGERSEGPSIPGHVPHFVPDIGAAALLAQDNKTTDLLQLDLQGLEVISRTHVGWVDRYPVFVGNGLVVLSSAGVYFPRWKDYSLTEPPPAPGERVDVPVIVLEQATGRELYRTSYSLANEMIVAACADRTRLIVGITGRDFTPDPLERRAIWYRVDASPIVPTAKAWHNEGEGFLGGNMLLGEQGVTFPLYEGPIPQPVKLEEKGNVYYRFGAHLLPLQAVTLDPGTGRRLATAAITGGPGERDLSGPSSRITTEQENPVKTVWAIGGREHLPGSVQSTVHGLMSRPSLLAPLFVPEAPRRIFAGTTMSVHADDSAPRGELFFYRPDRPPLTVLVDEPALRWSILEIPSPDHQETTALLWDERVFVSLGGGVILVKDFDAGNAFSDEVFSVNAIQGLLR